MVFAGLGLVPVGLADTGHRAGLPCDLALVRTLRDHGTLFH